MIEVYDNTTAMWERHVITRFSTSGQVCLQHRVRQREGRGPETWVDEGSPKWVDLSEIHYRWIA